MSNWTKWPISLRELIWLWSSVIGKRCEVLRRKKPSAILNGLSSFCRIGNTKHEAISQGDMAVFRMVPRSAGLSMRK